MNKQLIFARMALVTAVIILASCLLLQLTVGLHGLLAYFVIWTLINVSRVVGIFGIRMQGGHVEGGANMIIMMVIYVACLTIGCATLWITPQWTIAF